MADFEGSVNLEGIDDAQEGGEMEETTSENINNQEDESQNEETSTEDNQEETQDDNNEEESEDGDGKQELSDKGTKLDPNPQSRLHQELANAKKDLEMYREVLQNPKRLKSYIKELEEELGESTGQSEQDLKDKAKEEDFVSDPDKIETVDDLKSYAKFLKKEQSREIESIKREISKKEEVSRIKETSNKITSEIETVQKLYPELRPLNPDGSKNPDFDPALEKEVADLYEELDYDKKTGLFLGKVSVKAIADKVMRIRKLGESSGSKRAQTVVIDKRNGAVKTNTGGNKTTDESQMSAAQTIASRIQRAMKR